MQRRPTLRTRPWLLPIATAAALSACAVGPDYERPSAAAPAAFKEAPPGAPGWFPAAPADTLERGPWWELFGDAQLNRLAAQVEVSNQNVAAAVAAYAQARALVAQQRATLFPTIGLNASATRSGGGAALDTGNRLQLGANASWEPDIWGALRRGVEGAQASAQASAADLAAARLSAQGELATDYFALRAADAQIALTRSSVEGYERSLKITQDRYAAAIAAKTDVLQAQTLLDSTRANLATLAITRAQLEHAIAVLVGKAPAEFALPAADWNTVVPAVPLGVPSQLLQRRPDIASAERAVAAANAAIGVQRSAYFPALTLSGSYGNAGSRVADLIGASTSLWSLGLAATQMLFDAGATHARVEGAEAARDAAVARYRQTVLAAFQAVEDQLAAIRYLAEQADLRRSASQAADLTEQQLLNRYKQGLVAYTDVVTAQVSALNARSTLSQLASSRQAAAIGLIQALGGGWHAPAP
ncbi:MAG TPA: efflux transporter outer membrane subunit [Burkholderiaceae bacterium]|nr:efflux transporter outer membrane subunit [Burkholderiaceae bacterium]